MKIKPTKKKAFNGGGYGRSGVFYVYLCLMIIDFLVLCLID